MFARLAPPLLMLLAGCVRPPGVAGASCPCPAESGYVCDPARGICVAGTADPAPPPPPGPPAGGAGGVCKQGSDRFLPRQLVRLTPVQLASAITDLTGYSFSPRELPVDGDNEHALAVWQENEGFFRAPSPEAALILADVARRAATAMTVPPECTGPSVAPACFAFLVERTARASHRLPTDEEVIDLDGTVRADAFTMGADSAARAAIEVLIQSPQFVYRSELGTLGTLDTVTLEPDEIASALSFVFTDGPPDQVLLDARDDLIKAEVRATQAYRLSLTAAGRAKTARFLAAYADIDRLVTAPPEALPSQAVAEQMTLESASLFGYVLDQGGSLAELFGAESTFLGPELAAHYGVPLGVTGPKMVTVPGRVGLLNQGSFLVTHPPGPTGLPAWRGVAVAAQLFGTAIPVVPVDMPLSPPSGPDLPVRDRYHQVVDMGTCLACHAVFDPLGLGLEKFDGLGRRRELQGGKPIDTSISDYPMTGWGGRYADTVELASKVMATPAGQAGFASQYLAFALGTPPSCGIPEVSNAFTAGNARLPALLEATAASVDFVTRRAR